MSDVKAVAHTAGPWRADIYPRIGNHAGSFSVEVDGLVICGRAGVPTRASESAANARLIAAAPELLEAAQTAISFLRCIEWTDDSTATDSANIEHLLDAAIAKAEGTTP